MKISLYQQDIVWLDIEANYAKIEETLKGLPDTDLLILPEMCTTGFITIPSPGQLPGIEETEARLKALSAQYNTALCGSFAVTDGTHNYNRAYFVRPDGSIDFADKHHLFAPGGEDKHYTAGTQRTIAEYMGVRFLLLVCFDLRFPVWSRYDAGNEYDIVIYVANWPQQRQLAWDTLLAARAIENQAYAIGVNRIGTDPICPYQGGSRAIHPYGHAVASCPDLQESVCTFEPDMIKLHEYRAKFKTIGQI